MGDYEKATVIATFPLHFFSMGTILLIVSLLDKIANSLAGGNQSIVIWFETSYQAAFAIGLLFWGYIVGKVNKRAPLLLLGYSSLAGTILLMAFAPNFLVFGIARTAIGLIAALSYPLSTSLISDAVEAERRIKTFGRLYYMELLGQAVFLVYGIVLRYFLSWRVIIASLAFPILAFLVPNIKYSEPSRGASEEALKELLESGQVYTYTITKREMVEILKRKTNLMLSLQGLFGMIAWTAFNRFSPWFFVSAFQISLQAALIPGSLVLLGWIAGYPIIGYVQKIRERGEYRKVMLLLSGMAILIATIYELVFIGLPHPKIGYTEENTIKVLLDIPKILALIFTNPMALLVILLLFVSAMLIVVFNPTILGTLSEANLPEQRGAAIAVEKVFENVGMVLGIAVVAVLSDVFVVNGEPDWSMILAVAFLSLYATSIFWFLAARFVEREIEEVRAILKERAK